MRKTPIILGILGLAFAVFIVWAPQWTFPPIGAQQFSPGPSMIQFQKGHMYVPVSQTPPPVLPPAAPGGPMAKDTYKNVQVLTDVSAGEFMRLQQAITQAVSPTQGCGFCHAGDDYASDAKPQKQVARVMMQMVRHINADWGSHVGDTGVTCYTCHRGQVVPSEVWYPSVPRPERPIVAKQDNWRESADNVHKFFPDDSFDLYLLGDTPISVQSITPLPSQTTSQQIVAKRVYEMMMEMSEGIGVNCTFCHNSRAFFDWRQSTPQRWTGQTGIDMTRALNRDFLQKVHGMLSQSRERVHNTIFPVIPDRESGAQPADAFVLCGTCHAAKPKPLNGAAIAAAYPGLKPAANAAEAKQ